MAEYIDMDILNEAKELMLIGIELIKLGKYQEAINRFYEVIKIKPKNKTGGVNLECMAAFGQGVLESIISKNDSAYRIIGFNDPLGLYAAAPNAFDSEKSINANRMLGWCAELEKEEALKLLESSLK